MVHLDYRDTRPIYTQIVDGFRSQITAGVLQEGDKLPSVRELAAALAINPNTIQRAYRELEGSGLIVTITGKGCFVCGRPDNGADLWKAFDEAADRLRSQGIGLQQMLEHLQQGGI